MQQFLMDYGLWLLAAALIVIAVVFLLTRGEGTGAPAAERLPNSAEVEATTMEPIAAAIAPIAPEPVEAAPEASAPASEPAPQPDIAPPAPAGEEADDLLRMKGVGPKLNARLIELGITRFSQIAAWSAADIEAVDAQLGAFKGRPVRDQWVDQARYLANGDVAGFEAKYGKL